MCTSNMRMQVSRDDYGIHDNGNINPGKIRK